MTATNTPWLKGIGGTYFRFVDGEKLVKFPAVGTVPELVIKVSA